jgi:hypothetical protein
MTFDANATVPFEKARSIQTPAANIVNDTTVILPLGKDIETLNHRHLVSAGSRGDSDRGRPQARVVYEPSCFWCGLKSHSLIDCTGPSPNPDSKLSRDEMIAARAQRDRDIHNADRKTSRLASAATSVAVSDDEDAIDELPRPPSRGLRPFLVKSGLNPPRTK